MQHSTAPEIGLTQPIPIFRIFDEAKAREFYLGFLDMEVEFEHRFDANAPLYLAVRRDAMRLHLSEHFGDASPAATAIMYMTGVEALQRGLLAKDYRYNRPGLQQQPWGLECTVTDPFGNRLRFLEPAG